MAVHRFFICAFAALPLLVTDAAAQNAARYRSWDLNNDGVLTRSEWRGSVQSFRDLDWNGDGILSGNELRDPGRQDDWSIDTFAALDRNGDGRLTRGEWRADRAMFRQVDRNADNHISRGEFMNANAGDMDTSDFGAMDYDRSGRIELNEWNGTRATFNRLDVNRDGVLTRRELAADDAAVVGLDDFDAFDDNGNGVISRTEWRGSAATFNRFDTNRDGVVSRREYAPASRGGVVQETLQVDSRQPWTNTGIHVTAGDVITFRADGMIQMSTNPDDRATPMGSISGRNATNSPRPDQRAGGLLLRIGNGPVQFVGEGGSYTAPVSGQLHLGVNDDHFPDNTGTYRVALSIQQR
jgi:Ca2+-binding EF-hand superfamily protein